MARTGQVTTDAEAKAAQRASRVLRNLLRSRPGQGILPLIVDDGSELEVPRAALELLREILDGFALGQPMMVGPARSELTTQEAADLLNVSRPYLIKLLDAAKIEYRMVGTHRRVDVASLNRFLVQAREGQRRALAELTKITEDLDLSHG